jgi:hypothetical protein
MADESILSGGISNSVAEAPILPVQGGGGLGTNTHGIGEIKVVEGGQQNTDTVSNVQIVQNYEILDKKQYGDFLKRFTPTTKLENAIKNIKIKAEKILHYGVKGDISVLNSRNTTNLVQIKIIPITTKKLVILPPFESPEQYINQFMFLIANDFMEIDSKNNFVIRKNIFVISLAPFKDEPLIKYLYSKLKSTNKTSYYVVNDKPFTEQAVEPFNVFVHPKDNGIFISKKDVNFSKPIKPEDLQPTNFDVINEYNIPSMKYRGNPSDILPINISDGEDEPRPITEYKFTLKNHIAVISLIDEDIQTINIDLQGNKYRMRIPYVNNKTDKIYDDWLNGKYKMGEEKLVKDLHLEPGDEIPKFLFNLAYFKCFDDVSLLTKAECSSMKTTLDSLYKRALRKYEKKGDSDSEHKIIGDSRLITSIESIQIDTEEPKKVISTIKYTENGVPKETKVELDESYIKMMATDEEQVNKAARKKFLGTK